MTRLSHLRQQLTALEAQIQELKAAGAIAYPADFVLDRSESKGKTYYRRRARQQGKPGKSEQISAELYNQLQVELARGKQIHKLEQQRGKITSQIDEVIVRITVLGGTSPVEKQASLSQHEC